jgi:putative ABC transport system permease protein
MRTLLQDLRYGFRMMGKAPGVTAIAILTMALGIGINTAVFSLVNVLLFEPLPYPEQDRIVQLWESNLPKGWDQATVSPPNYLDWKAQSKSFEGMALYTRNSFALTGKGEPERVEGMLGTINLLDILGVKPALGRGFLPGEDRPGAERVAIISHGLYERRFAASPEVIGRKIELNGAPYTVVGVMPRGYTFLYAPVEIWTTLDIDPAAQDRDSHGYLVIGRLAKGISREQAQSEMNLIAGRLDKQYPDSNKGWGVAMNTAWEEVFDRDTPTALLTILLSVLFVLLIGCANVANLLLARAASREREISIRRALGAGRARLIRQILTESVMLSMCGGIAGVLVAVWGVEVLKAIAPKTVPRIDEVGIDAPALLYMLGLSLACGILFGLAPALQRNRPDLMVALRESGRGASGHARHRLLKTLVVSEVALALVLLAAAGLMIRSVQSMFRIDPGFRTENLLAASIALPEARYPEQAQRSAFFRQALEQVRSVPEIEAASVVTTLPLAGWNSWTELAIEGRPIPPAGQENSVGYLIVGTDYFKTLGIRLLQGRDFTEQDAGDAAPVAVINETMARHYWPGEDAVGRGIRSAVAEPDAPWIRIVGVVADVRHQNLFEPPRTEMYRPEAQKGPAEMTFIVRTKSDPLRWAPTIRQKVWGVDRDLPLFDVRVMQQLIDRRTEGSRAMAKVMGGPAVIALLMAAFGLYGVLAFSVTERTNEIGIRVALGARSRDILRMIIRQGLVLISIGMVIGLAGALAVTQLLRSLLSGTSPTDPSTYLAVGVILFTAALLACYLPARRAARVDPVVALRYE